MAYIYEMTDSWDDSSIVYTGLSMNITKTAASGGSMLMDLVVNSGSLFNIDESGNTRFAGNITGQNITAQNIAANTILSTGGLTASSIVSSGNIVTSSISSTGDITARNIVATGGITASGASVFYSTTSQQPVTSFLDKPYVGGRGGYIAAYSYPDEGMLFGRDSNNHSFGITSNGVHLGLGNAYSTSAPVSIRDTYVTLNSSATLKWSSSAQSTTTDLSIGRTASGTLLLSGGPSNSFNMLQFGGTTSSYPSIMRSGADIAFRSADNTQFAKIMAGRVYATGGRLLGGVHTKPAYSFGEAADTCGFDYDTVRTAVAYVYAGAVKVGFGDYISVANIGGMYWSQNGDALGGLGTALVSDGNGTIAQRNSTNPQAFHIYNTYTNAANREYLSINFTGS